MPQAACHQHSGWATQRGNAKTEGKDDSHGEKGPFLALLRRCGLRLLIYTRRIRSARGIANLYSKPSFVSLHPLMTFPSHICCSHSFHEQRATRCSRTGGWSGASATFVGHDISATRFLESVFCLVGLKHPLDRLPFHSIDVDSKNVALSNLRGRLHLHELAMYSRGNVADQKIFCQKMSQRLRKAISSSGVPNQILPLV